TGVARGFWMFQGAVLFAWTHTLLLTTYARRNQSANSLERWLAELEDPRWIFYTGLAGHLVLFAIYSSASVPQVAQALAYGGPATLAGILVVIGGYVGYRIPSGTVGLRLAGLLHPAADGLKFAFKEDFIPPGSDKLLHSLAPMISLFPALVIFAVIPFGDRLCFEKTAEGLLDITKGPVMEMARDGVCAGIEVPLQVADVNVGILFMFAIAGTGIVGAAIAGWSSDNKWSLLGGLRAASQMVSYEVAIGLSLAGAFMIYGTPRLNEMVRWQSENTWGIFVQPLAFFLFFAAAIAEQKRAPFDAPEGESEIIAGYMVEYSSFKFAMFMTGEYIEVAVHSALLVTIFLGGWSLPFLHPDGITITFGDTVLYKSPMTHLGVTILQVAAFYLKSIVLMLLHIAIRWTLLRFRYDQIMAFGWKFLLPATIGNLVMTGLGILVVDQAGPTVASALRMVADATNFLLLLTGVVLAVRFFQLLLSPVERKRFFHSTAALRAARFGGTKHEAMQA
ncbi:MAG: complex I subunit 1 family protein, partial [Myxococcales bacterium]|nr:NADH-quinone oxidoreductase subunit H [Polyangiaceae bacterium]MDW8252037.1 complex I subunit 1 family protein [Myxococcales bacterium]